MPEMLTASWATQNFEKMAMGVVSFWYGLKALTMSCTPNWAPRYTTIPHVDGPMPLYREKKAILFDCFLHAVKHTVVLFHLAQVSAEHGTDVDERVHESVRDTTSSRTAGNLRRRKLAKVCLLIVFWEQLLDIIFESQVESSGRNVTDTIRNVSTPE